MDNEASALQKTYVLRCWQTSVNSAESDWCFSLEPIGSDTASRVGFGELDELISFLTAQLRGQPPLNQ